WSLQTQADISRHRNLRTPALQSQRDCIIQPRVARNELPWGCCAGALNPERVLTEWSRTRTKGLGPMALVVLFLVSLQTQADISRRRNSRTPILQSQRDCIIQPRVARNELPWGCCAGALNPERVLTEWSRTRTEAVVLQCLIVLFL